MGETVTDVGAEIKSTKKELKKHAATIHCSNTLSLLQRKIANALLYHAYKDLMQHEEHEITVKQLCSLIGYQGNNHAAIKEALKGLISTIIEWNLIDEVTGSENWTASSIIASVSLEGSLCYYAYSPRMKQLLYSPSMFGKIDLVIQSKFRSSYGLALYENCIRYRGLPHTKWFEISLFKKLMGISTGMYEIFRDFKRRVLDKAVDEVNTYSDLILTTDLVREGRKVVKIRFLLKERAKKMRLGAEVRAKHASKHKVIPTVDQQPELSEKEIITSKLTNVFNLSEKQIKQVLKEYDNEYILGKMRLVESSKAFINGKIVNTAAYMLSALKMNYQLTKAKQLKPLSHAKTGDPSLPTLQSGKSIVEMPTLMKQIETIRADYLSYREHIIEETIRTLAPDKKQGFMQAFFQYAKTAIATILSVQRKKYTAETVLESPQIKAQLRQFALRELDDLLSLVSIEEFVAELSEKKRACWQKLKSFDPEHPLLKLGENLRP